MVSPGLRSRPSLSESPCFTDRPAESRRVAGATVPAFVERLGAMLSDTRTFAGVAGATIPAFVERTRCPPITSGKAVSPGATVPAFVERSTVSGPPSIPPSVAGATVPAFVERCQVQRTQR